MQRADRGPVDAPALPVDRVPPVHPAEDRLIDALPGAILGPAPEALITGLPRAVALRQVAPGTPSGEHPEDPVDHLAVRPPRPALAVRLGRPRQQGRNDAPGRFGQFMPTPNPIGPSCSFP